ncbi:MAG: restriction endonuclease subunit S [Marinospirillum sp.]|uniref:restriction endonuclease subunit S n=1 Tax=Marinospirillum sp. TaxID=2183934 RepID=UPI0019F34BDB|nr:restriction endonuclease subunit S [Marinospirillum sp.]MBE0508724.1 restriction endonuclease subunit S [Marinospirillum sp.]
MSERIPEGWCAEELGNLAKKIEGGGTPSRNEPSFWGGSIPWATVKDLRGTALCNTQESITEAGLENSSSKLIPANTLILACRMAVGKAVFFDRDVAINQDLKAFYPRSDVDWRFLLQWYVAKSHVIEGLATGSTVKGIRLENLKTLPINTPPLPEQKKIAAILLSVDEVIEKTRAQIDKLKDLKTGMMQELLTKGIGHTEFKDSPVGRIPASWKVTDLASIVVPKGLQTGPFGSQLHAHEYVEWGVPVVMPKDMKGSRIDSRTIAYIPLGRAEQLSKHRVKYGDVLFARRGDIGRFALVERANEGWLCGTGCLKARFAPSIDPIFISCYLMQPPVVEWLNANAVGQTMLNLNTSILADLPIILPPENEQKTIGGAISSLDSQVNSMTRKLAGLIKTKKALMQDLLTGKVRVKVDQKEPAVA